MVHCGCQKQRPFIDLTFSCATNNEEALKHYNLLDLSMTLRAMPLSYGG